MNKTIMYVLILILGVLGSSFSQILLKKAAGRRYGSWIAEYLNIRVIVAYVIFFLSFGVTVLVLRHLPLSLAAALESSGYVFVALLGFVLLKENLNMRQITAMALIVSGIVIFSL